MEKLKRSALAAAAMALVVIAVCACGSSSSGSGTRGTEVSGIRQVGAGLTKPTQPSGAKLKGGTVSWQESPGLEPNYIFPMTSSAVCSAANTSQFSSLLYRPLYYYGNDYRPTVDYDYSIGKPPVFSDNNTVVTIKLNSWKWSDGEPVSSRDIEFWMNLYKANPRNYCGYVPHLFPDNVTSMSTPNASTIVFHLNRSYNPVWFLYNELSQITPLPLAWDRTSLSQQAPTSNTGTLPDTTTAGAENVFNFLDTQSKAATSWVSSPLWSVVDGPWKLSAFSSGEATFVPNPDYSGSPKPTISTFIELPYASSGAAFAALSAGGPSTVTIGDLPAQDVPQLPAIEALGYNDNQASRYSFNYFPLNFNNPAMGPIFKQLYFRQAFQHLVDQPGWIGAILDKAAVQTTSPVPAAPPTPLVPTSAAANSLAFSIADAEQLLTSNGWKVVPGGASKCVRPGTAHGECGAGISSGEPITFTIAYAVGTAAVGQELLDLQAQAKRVGITLTLTSGPFEAVKTAAVRCNSAQASCSWAAQDWGSGTVYARHFLPTGESLFASGGGSNASGYSNVAADALIDQTMFAPTAAKEAQALSQYANLMAKKVPVVYQPTSVGIYGAVAGTLVSSKLGGFAAQAFSYLTPEAWYFTS